MSIQTHQHANEDNSMCIILMMCCVHTHCTECTSRCHQPLIIAAHSSCCEPSAQHFRSATRQHLVVLRHWLSSYG